MKLLLVIPPSPEKKKIIRTIDCSHEAKANYLWQPNDFMIISSLLGPSDAVVLIDGTADALSDEQYDRAIGGASADLIVCALSSVCWESDYSYFRAAREQFAHVPFYVLGDIFLDERYRQFILGACDGIIFNPYQLDLTAMMHRKNSTETLLPGVCTDPAQTLFSEGKRPMPVSSGVPRHEVFLRNGYRFPFARKRRFTTVTTVWGCPFSCSYCSDSRFTPVVRSYEDVLVELQYIERLGIRELFFADKVFGYSKANVFPLLERMIRDFHFSWSCYFHPQLYEPGLLDMMRLAGCHTIITGIDSADADALLQYNRRVSSEKIMQLVQHARRLQVDVCADFILGLPHETADDVRRTIQFALDLPIDFASFNVAAPLPGSGIREQAAAEGTLVFGQEGFDTCGRLGIMGHSRISTGQLRMLRKAAFRRFYLRPSYLVRRIRRTESLEHLLIQIREMFSMMRKT